MKVYIGSILKETGAKQYIDIEEHVAYSEDNLKLNGPVHVKGNAVNAGKCAILTVDVSTEVLIECARCLQEFNYPLNFTIEEQYCKSVKEYKDLTGEYELQEEDFTYLIAEDNTIDLYETLRQNIISNLPIRVICRPDCKGIITEQKKEGSIDPRLERLREIKENL